MSDVDITFITPWFNHPELIDDYAHATQHARVIIVDNNSEEQTASRLYALVKQKENKSKYIKLDKNAGFGVACNLGIENAESDWVFCLNNDIASRGNWLSVLQNGLQENAIVGASIAAHIVCGIKIPYVEGWLIGTTRENWKRLKGFDTQRYEFAYYEDADLCFRAVYEHKMQLIAMPHDFPLKHLSNTTSRTVSFAYERAATNRLRFFDYVTQSLSAPVSPDAPSTSARMRPGAPSVRTKE